MFSVFAFKKPHGAFAGGFSINGGKNGVKHAFWREFGGDYSIRFRITYGLELYGKAKICQGENRQNSPRKNFKNPLDRFFTAGFCGGILKKTG